jgi:hypothetical protein
LTVLTVLTAADYSSRLHTPQLKVPKKQAKIANLQHGVDAWREKNAFELDGKDWMVHVGSQTVFMPAPAMGSRHCSSAWQCWTPPGTAEVPEGVVRISNEEWRRVRNTYVKDVWVWPECGADGVCRLLRLHELLAL